MQDSQLLYLTAALAPLVGAVLTGLFGKVLGRRGSHLVAIAGVATSFVLSVVIAMDVWGGATFDGALYTWAKVGDLALEVGFLIDPLTVTMMLVVTFVSLMVHIYTVGYMADDDGYQRFFSYISLFTFSMLMLVMSNNFLQLFFGWEAVGLVSYLLIGFWFKRPSATYANLKAFLVNRVGDFGFLLGIGLIAAHFGSLNYAEVFAAASDMGGVTVELIGGHSWMLVSVICICLFIGAMGKSAQVPLHVWLPDSMEGPTPISALIHAATMVTAGIFMVSRMSPLFEMSESARAFVLVIGATTALFMGFLGIVQNDIKRVVAYSTLSQLGYMTVALGVSAYSAAVFHLMTHAFFKALLFLAAGSVIIGMHHDQDIRNMGGLWRRMPVTWITSLLGSLALIGFPFFSGFFSKDAIIEAVKIAHTPGAGYAYACVLIGVFVTAFYSFRMYFLVFHGNERFHSIFHGGGHGDGGTHGHHHGSADGPVESPWVITVPLVLLAIPSVLIGYLTIGGMLFGNTLGSSVVVLAANDVVGRLAEHFEGPAAMALHGFGTAPFALALSGIVAAWVLYVRCPAWPGKVAAYLRPLALVLENKYYFDRFNEVVFAAGARFVGRTLWRAGDQAVIDGVAVNGTARVIGSVAGVVRQLQTGHIYQYAFAIIIGVAVFLWFWFGAAVRQLLS